MLTGLWFEVYISLKYKSLTSILQTLVHHVIQHLQCFLFRLRLLTLLTTTIYWSRHLMFDRMMLGGTISVDHLILFVLIAVHVFNLFTVSTKHHVLLFGFSLSCTHISQLKSQLINFHLHGPLNSLGFDQFASHFLNSVIRTLESRSGHGLLILVLLLLD